MIGGMGFDRHFAEQQSSGPNVRFVPKADVNNRSKAARYSITSSARADRVGGNSRPSAFAVLRLIAN
jgi:hypothetical protein